MKFKYTKNETSDQCNFSDRLVCNETQVYGKNLHVFFFFFSPQLLTLSIVNNTYVYCSRSHKLHFLRIFLLKMGLTTLFTYLKIISLQCFQFQFSISAKIGSIQTHPQSYFSVFFFFRC